jgi:hypothetical protein
MFQRICAYLCNTYILKSFIDYTRMLEVVVAKEIKLIEEVPDIDTA